ncbi:DUF7283 family protein [Halorubrum lacusprofundi]|uniref:Uncharacterized protein n=1 Tax=Halorubrum lacusprofundi (strain ATCC 49239 / DSM 5036 / JCM 8891 / ACAM 34) TaxID=416348 RepID=B9LRH5_HALLT|nr:hypothetical protein [Halorubrum lacusprofundi]ACM55798.1 conserved hypothetical protein [Halorubrum lacusprofundi ATCC 49239]MCG1006668.1 hypothetical protein [Halorubrum lacusprofundi]
MFETNLDATYAWIGLAMVSVATAGVVGAFPASPPPDASGVAHTIDSIADDEYPARAEHGLAANRIRLTTGSVALDGGGGTARASLRAPRITPVPTERRETTEGDGLRRVLSGVPPDAAFDDPEEFAAAAERARRGDHEWRPAPDRLTVRRVHYGEVHVTLVG